MTGLYVHIPICRKKCGYCDFYSLTSVDKKGYEKAVLRNIARYTNEGAVYDTIYFGGGTPSLAPMVIESVIKNAPHIDEAEITVECNPDTVDESRLLYLKKSGVNRISFGVQSLCDEELSALGRIHSAKSAKKAMLDAKLMGFKNISADIMLGIPKQTKNSLEKTINELCELPITHVSAYMLKIEENTPFAKKPPEIPSDEETAELYLFCVSELEKRGFFQYEISNFAKRGFECRHNLKYWKAEEYIGIGPAAHSFYGKKRFCCPRDVEAFINSENQPEELMENFPDADEERVVLGLRLCEGIEINEKISARLGGIPNEYYKLENGKLSLTPKGFLVSNEIIAKLTL